MPIVMPIIRSHDTLWLELGYGLGTGLHEV